MRHVTAALLYLHDSRKTDSDGNAIGVVVHGGIKPPNILLNDNVTQIVLSDVEVCRDVIFKHTSPYTAPEVLRGGNPISASGMWSFGLVLYELVAECKMFTWYLSDPSTIFTPD